MALTNNDETAAANFTAEELALRNDLMRPGYRNYVLFIVLFGFALNFLDRQIISILLQPIKEDLQVSDTMLGFLSGLSFALFYATLGIPIAAMADRGSRKVILAVSIGVWSVMTAMCGLAQNFVQLLLARFGVGIGEAGYTPASLSIVADYFEKEKRAWAVAFTSVGAMLGIVLGMVIGGYVAEHWGWRAAMFIAGAPGLLFAFVVWFTVREPLRGMADGVRPKGTDLPGVWKSASTLWRIPSFAYISVGAGLSAMALYGFSMWLPSLLAREFGMGSGQIGLILGPVIGGVGAVGALVSGYICDKLFKRDPRWVLWVPVVASLLALPVVALAFTMEEATPLIALYGLGYFLSIFWSPPTSSILSSLMPLRMRASGLAWKMLMVNLVGLGLGPQAIGFLSESLRPAYGDESLRYAMIFATPVFIVPAILYWLGSRHILADSAKYSEAKL